MTTRPLSLVRRNICVLLLALLVLSWGYFVFSFARDYRTIEQQSSKNIRSLAIGLEAHTRQAIQIVDILLLDVIDHFPKYSSAELKHISKEWLKRLPDLTDMAIIDVASAAVIFSASGLERSVVPSVTPSAEDSSSVQIAASLLRSAAGQNQIVLFRSFRQGERRLQAIALLRADYLLGFRQDVNLGPNGSVSIFHHNGFMLARKPHGEQLVGRSFAAGPLFSKLLPTSADGISRAPKTTDGISRIVAHRKLADLPLVVTVGTSVDWIFADWQNRLINFIFVQFAVSVAIILSLVLLMRTILRVEKAEIELEEREEHFRSVANSSVDAVISVDIAERIRFWSIGAEHVFDCPAAEAVAMPITCFLQFAAGDKPLTLKQHAEADRPWSQRRTLIVQGQRKKGELFPTELSVSYGTAAGQLIYTLIVRDVTEQKQLEERIRRLASHDNLTHLPNRGLLMDRLQVAMAQVRRQGGLFALLFIDLDRFKPVNDTYGHDIGDQLLQQVAKRMLAAVRASDTVARVGGDEFAVLLTNVEDAASVDRACENLLVALRKDFSVSGNRVSISCSIGVVIFNGQDATETELIGRADIAMYAAKRAGKNRYVFADS